MPIISFDVLLPDTPAATLEQRFRTALSILVDKGLLSGAQVEHHSQVDAAEEYVEQLRANHRAEHGEELVDAALHRYLITAVGENVSYNELAMSLSRILTPQADLPRDPVALEREAPFEVSAYYPWAVEIRR